MSNMVVRTNVMSLNSHRNLGMTGNMQARSAQRLSSGFRINSAADDAAGLGISEKMRGQIRGLDQASRNGQDGISLIQTAEGAMSTINEMVIRIRELVIQASNDTNAHEDGNLAQSDRMRIQDEINQLMDEIDATRNRTQFNTRNLIDGSLSSGGAVSGPGAPGGPGGTGPVEPPDFSAGNSLEQTILDDIFTAMNFVIGAMDYESGNIFAFDTPLTAGDLAAGFELRPGQTIGNLEAFVTAQINTALADIIGFDHVLPPTAMSLADTEAAVIAWLSGGNELGLNAYVGSNIHNLNELFAAADDANHLFNSVAVELRDLLMDAVNDIDLSGFLAETPPAVESGFGTVWNFSGVAPSLGNNFTILNAANGHSMIDAALHTDVTTAVNLALHDFVLNHGADVMLDGAAMGVFSIGHFNAWLNDAANDLWQDANNAVVAGSIANLNEFLGAMDHAADTAGLTAEGQALRDALRAAIDEAIDSVVNAPETPDTGTPGTPTTGNALWFQIGANVDQGVRLNIEDVGTAALSAIGTSGQKASEIGNFTFARLRTVESTNAQHGAGGAPTFDPTGGVVNASGEQIQNFITAIDEALAHVTAQRSNLGAMQNRLEYSIENLDIASENLQAAESRIRDADMAREMMRFTQSNVLQQAAISMLAQANQAPQSILQLLG